MIELTPEHLQIRDSYRERISQFIAGLAVCTQVEEPMPNIGFDESETLS